MERRPTRIRTTLAGSLLALTLIAPWALGQDPAPIAELRRQAEQGDPDAQSILGNMYRLGRGVPQDEAEAVRWYRLAAEQGLAGWQAPSLRSGGTSQSLLAAKQGYALTQYNLGRMYFLGLGVLKNADEAVRRYRLAAEQGHAKAQGSLGLMFALGQGVREDHGRAHMWFNIASANGDDTARAGRDALEPFMTPTDIRRATERARKCMASDYQDCER